MVKNRQFGELEWTILQLVKEKGEVSVKQIHAVFNDSVAYTTVMTVMSRLAAKGELARKKEGRQYLYCLPRKTERSSLGLVEKLKQRLFGGRSAAMIRYLIDSGEDLTEADLEEMKTMIQEARKRNS